MVISLASLVPDTINNNTFLAPVILLSFNKGESKALEIACFARSSPDAAAEPMIAVPLFDNTVLASLRSIFCV